MTIPSMDTLRNILFIHIVLNRLSIAHCKALGESCLLSHKSSSWGVVGRSYGRQKKMANGTMKMVKASLKLHNLFITAHAHTSC